MVLPQLNMTCFIDSFERPGLSEWSRNGWGYRRVVADGIGREERGEMVDM